MSTLTEAEIKEQKRIKRAAYNAQEYVKERNREASSRRGKEKTLISTAHRLQKHSVDELMFIAQLQCANARIPWEENKAKIIEVLNILHGTYSVLSEAE